MDSAVSNSSIEVANDLTAADLRSALQAGWNDFAAQPLFGLFFSAIYVAIGLFLSRTIYVQGDASLLIAAVAGFPLIAPFTAVGLYEVSRRRSECLPKSWSAVLGAPLGRGDQQLILMGGIMFVAFSFWVILAHGIFAIFMSQLGSGAESIDALMTPTGLAMLAVGSVVGALVALFFYAITIFSLPILVDRDVDFITAIIGSLASLRANCGVLLGWAVLIAIALFLSMLPAFLGLLVILPVLGHATWHLYRRAIL